MWVADRKMKKILSANAYTGTAHVFEGGVVLAHTEKVAVTGVSVPVTVWHAQPGDIPMGLTDRGQWGLAQVHFVVLECKALLEGVYHLDIILRDGPNSLLRQDISYTTVVLTTVANKAVFEMIRFNADYTRKGPFVWPNPYFQTSMGSRSKDPISFNYYIEQLEAAGETVVVHE